MGGGDGPAMFPVTYTRNPQGQLVAHWTALPYAVIKDLRRLISEAGVRSFAVAGMVDGIAAAHIMTPQDWKNLFRMVLSAAQYVVWDSEFKQAALTAPNARPDEIYGAGAFASITAQTTYAAGIYATINVCALRAFKRVPEMGKPTKSFTAIKQANNEPYAQFIERLREAIFRQVDGLEAQEELMLKLSYENANSDCKRALDSIVRKPPYELADMIRACADIGSQSYNMELLAGALQRGQNPPGQSHTPAGNCYNCKKPGHFRKDCRDPGGGAHKDPPQKGKPSTPCPKCRKGFHWARECRAGNGRAGGPSAPAQ